jgi:DNA (cytosine-5)-methyltransferase 1
MLKVLDLFSGIGGFSLGLERTGGFETVAFCEIEKFPQKVLAKHWPEVPIYEDVRNVTAKQLRSDGIIPNVITGGFPCQDISVAGNQKGMGEGTRSGLWSECARLLGEIRPDYAIFENVTALLSGDNGKWFERVLWDLSEVGYDAEWHCIPASELGANHHRDRVWIIAYPRLSELQGRDATQADNDRCGEAGIQQWSESPSLCGDVADTKSQFWDGNEDERGREIAKQEIWSLQPRGQSLPRANKEKTANTKSERLQGSEKPRVFKEGREGWLKLSAGQFCGFDGVGKIEPTICGGVNGIPNHAHRLKGLGNAICPPISELIGRAILEAENEAM